MKEVLKAKQVGPQSRSWWNGALQEATERRTIAHAKLRNFERSLTENADLAANDVWLQLHQDYVHLRQTLQTLIHARKKETWLKQMASLEVDFFNDQRHFFAEISRLRGRKKAQAALQSLRPPNDECQFNVTSNPAELKSILVDFHSKLGTEDSADPAFNRVMYETIVADLNMIDSTEKGPENCEVPFQIKEIQECVRTVKNTKAAGIDMIHNEAIKHAGPQFISTLTATFNSFWQTENTPSVWAKASIHLIYKGNDSDMLEAASYRPISLTSNISKIFEKAILMRMETGADGALPEEQAGFRKDRSCTDQIFILREVIESRQNSRLPTYACFIDLKQAFPSTWRDAIWHRLRKAGISGKMYRVIRTLYMNT